MSNIRLITLIMLTITFVFPVNCHSLTCADDPQEPTNKSFALSDAPEFNVDKKTRARINQVIRELKQGHGGSLVSVPEPDPVLDTPEFVAYYVRAFAELDDATVKGLSSYSYRFKTLINRHWSSPEVLKDPRLDWDLWRAFLIFEELIDGKRTYKKDNTVYDVTSASNLLWRYLQINIEAIRTDPERLEWWIDVIAEGMVGAKNKSTRSWLLLYLVISADTQTKNRPRSAAVAENDSALPTNVYIGTDAHNPFLAKAKDSKLPQFAAAIEQIAKSFDLTFEFWGIDEERLRPTKSFPMNRFSESEYIGQESWSKDPAHFRPAFSTDDPTNVSTNQIPVPAHEPKDGVFFFTYDACLYVWPKTKMIDGSIGMLRVAGFIDETKYSNFVKKGVERLVRGENDDSSKKKIASQNTKDNSAIDDARRPIIVLNRQVDPVTGRILGPAIDVQRQQNYQMRGAIGYLPIVQRPRPPLSKINGLEIVDTTSMPAVNSTNWRQLKQAEMPSTGIANRRFTFEVDIKKDCWILGRKNDTNEEVFRFRLPENRSRMLIPIDQLFHLRSLNYPTNEYNGFKSLFVDPKGRVRFRESQSVMSALEIKDDLIILRATGIARLATDEIRKWTTNDLMADDILGVGHLMRLPDGDMIAASWGTNSDSGVKLIRFQPVDGKIVWDAYCDSLGVFHTTYSHSVEFAIRGDRILVISNGASTFVESRNLKDGTQETRWLYVR